MASIRLSNLSSIPPCPGSMFPESFTPNVRFSSDSTKSPHVPNTTTTTDSPSQLHRLISGTYHANACEAISVTTSPPKKPSHDFFGEMRSNSLLFPINEPAR